MFHVGYSPTNYNSTFYQNKATNNNTEKKEQDKSQLPRCFFKLYIYLAK